MHNANLTTLMAVFGHWFTSFTFLYAINEQNHSCVAYHDWSLYGGHFYHLGICWSVGDTPIGLRQIPKSSCRYYIWNMSDCYANLWWSGNAIFIKKTSRTLSSISYRVHFSSGHYDLKCFPCLGLSLCHTYSYVGITITPKQQFQLSYFSKQGQIYDLPMLLIISLISPGMLSVPIVIPASSSTTWRFNKYLTGT